MADTHREESRRRSQGGWVGALATLFGLVAAGFLAGAVIGFLWEEPRLVMAYLSGDTESVAWSDPVPDLDLPVEASDVASAPPASEPAPEAKSVSPPAARPAPQPRPAPAAKPAPAPAPKPVAKPAPATAPKPVAKPAPAPAAKQTAAIPSGRFAVQVGAFSESTSAEGLVQQLKKRGFSAYLSPAPTGAARWRVRVGPLSTRPEAEKVAEKLERSEELSTWVLDENAN